MAQQNPFPPSSPPRVGLEWSTLIVVVAVLFLLAVVAFYVFVR